MAVVSRWKLDGDATDSAGTNDGSVVGVTASWSDSLLASEPTGQSLNCEDGTSGVQVADDNSLDQPGTWIASFRLDEAADDGQYLNVVGKGSDDWFLQVVGTAGLSRVEAGVRDASGTYFWAESDPLVEVGVTYRVAVTNDGSTLRLYVDGVEADTVTGTAARNTTNPLRIGVNTPTAFGLHGLIDEVVIDDSPLTGQQVADEYDAATTPPDPDPGIAVKVKQSGSLVDAVVKVKRAGSVVEGALSVGGS